MTLTEVALGIAVSAVTASGLFFNSYILFFACTRSNSQNRTASQFLLFHLGILNLLLALFSLLAFVPIYFKDDWLQDSNCTYIGPFWDLMHITAIWTIMSLNVDKYITIASPLHYSRFVSPLRILVVLFMVWVVSAIIVTPTSLIHDIFYKVSFTSGCIVDVSAATFLNGTLHACITSVLGFLFPVFVVGLTNGRILVIASHHKHRIVAALWDVTLSAQATVTQQKSHFYLTNYRGKSAATTIFHHVGSLLILYLPTTVCRVYEAVTKENISPAFSKSAFILLLISPAVNGFVYGVKSKILRKTFMQVLRKQIYKSEVSCEIQARTPSASCSRRPSITPSITLPIQKQLTRRMSEIFIPTCATPTSSQNSFEGKRLERQSSDLSCGRSSEASTPKTLTPSPFRVSGSFFSNKFFPKSLHLYRCSEPNTQGDLTSKSLRSTSSSSFGVLRQASLEMMTNGTHNGGHRQSLRRALFARNKQKSLDLDTAQDDKHVPKSFKYPPRSASHHHMQEQPQSPSMSRPLMVSSDPLTPARKNKKVSWSSDSFSSTDKSVFDSPFPSDNDINSINRQRKRNMFRHNGTKTLSKLSLDNGKEKSIKIINKHSDYDIQSIKEPNGYDARILNGPSENHLILAHDSCDLDFELEYESSDHHDLQLVNKSSNPCSKPANKLKENNFKLPSISNNYKYVDKPIENGIKVENQSSVYNCKTINNGDCIKNGKICTNDIKLTCNSSDIDYKRDFKSSDNNMFSDNDIRHAIKSSDNNFELFSINSEVNVFENPLNDNIPIQPSQKVNIPS